MLSMRIKYILGIAVATFLILMVPLIAMQFTEEVSWDLLDFIVMAFLLFGTGLAYELAAGDAGRSDYRAAVGLALFTTLLLVWVNGAVGIIGDGPVNLLYFAVPAAMFIGAAIARLGARRMVYVLLTTALIQAMIPVIALLVGVIDFASGVAKVFVLNGLFVLLFMGSALLFYRAVAKSS